jgi:chemotaxis protein MotB
MLTLSNPKLHWPALLVAPLLLSACVWQSDYDKLQAENEQLKQRVTADQAQITRLQGAIKYTVNSDLLFSSGGWELSSQGKQIIARFASQLAPTQEHKILVNGYTDNAPIGPALQRQSITSNQVLSQKRADSVMAYMISQGVNPNLLSAHGYGDTQPVASNDTPRGRAQNRRVELTLGPAA